MRRIRKYKKLLQLEEDFMAQRPQPVHVLIDWNSELRALKKNDRGEQGEIARRVLKLVCRDVGTLLNKLSDGKAMFLHLRAYHGWRRGYEPTLRRIGLEEARRFFSPNDSEDRGISAYSQYPKQVVRSLEFGDKLLGGRDARLCGNGISGDHHLPFTLQEDATGNLTEKMVDTALVADLIYLASEDDGSWIVVVGQDADLVPGILAADGLLYGTDRRVIFFARGGINKTNRKMDDLICRR